MLANITAYIDDFLRTTEIEDYPNALNGLQLQNSGKITKIGAAVDASEAAIQSAIADSVDLLLVHHGLFWVGLKSIVGATRRKLARAISGDIAIYSAHLPLDIHPEIGNNVLVARALGFSKLEPFLFHNGVLCGTVASVELSRADLLQRLESLFGRTPWVCAAGPEIISRIGIVTGGAGNYVEQVASENIDTYLSGEGPHHTFTLAQELGINLIYAGHYATETFGVRALAERVAKEFSLPWCFIDLPSGL
ncbi:MAG: Nif3-like dinuclear metal center hexameric protein [Verrucomicrobia bacterium]|nr:Nif3-like dinuclear metal center hexameric protein [Verrucomicrobiota bacterium]